MLEAGKFYRNNNGKRILIGGRIKHYSEFNSFVWSVSGDWYDEATGRFVLCTRRYCGFRLPVEFTGSCIENHEAVGDMDDAVVVDEPCSSDRVLADQAKGRTVRHEG
jgi:hypothetical protein